VRSSEPENQHPGAVTAVRAVADTFGGQVLLSATAVAALTELGLSIRRRRRPRNWAPFGIGLAIAYEAGLKPWMRSWGATVEERARALPGDELVANPSIEITHAVTIEAPIEEVWPWLAQIGQDRGGFYSYEWLENLAGCEMRNADQVHPEWQRREIGERVSLHPAIPGLAVTLFEPGHCIGLEGWGVFLVEPAGPGATRLIARGRIPSGAAAVSYRTLLELPHFVMQRKMLLGIKARAEATSLPVASET
jgi:hypothetical protein